MPQEAKIAHHVRGRMRVRLPGARKNADLIREIAEALAEAPGVLSVEGNAGTGSIVVHYDRRFYPDIHESLAARGHVSGLYALEPPELSEVDRVAEAIEREAQFLAAHSETARVIVDSVKRLNLELKRATGNSVDLKVLLPLGLAAWAVVEHDPELVTPLWLTLSIFSFNSFVALHPPIPSVSVESEQLILQRGGQGSVEGGANPLAPGSG